MRLEAIPPEPQQQETEMEHLSRMEKALEPQQETETDHLTRLEVALEP